MVGYRALFRSTRPSAHEVPFVRPRRGSASLRKLGSEERESWLNAAKVAADHVVRADGTVPWRPTISATCSELGTGTHSVMFCDFFPERASSGKLGGGGARRCWSAAAGVSAAPGAPAAAATSVKPSMDSSKASCSARWSSNPPALLPSKSENRLAGITAVITTGAVVTTYNKKKTLYKNKTL